MTSVLPPQVDRRAARMKPKTVASGNEKNPSLSRVDETRSFLNFSRENLSMSHSELEQGFNKPSRCFRISRHTLLSLIAIVVALVCAGIESWKLHRVISNTRDIEIIKRDLETLRHRFFGEDFMDELKAFEEQLYADGTEAEEDSGEADIEGADYDNNYEEDYSGPSWTDDYVADSSEPTVVQDSENPSKKDGESRSLNRPPLVEMLAVLHKVETKSDQDSKESKRPGSGETSDETNDSRQNIKEDHPAKRRRAITEDDTRERNRTRHRKGFEDATVAEDPRTSRRGINGSRIAIMTETTTRDRHPPKKYFSVTRSVNGERFASSGSRRHSITRFGHHRDLRRFRQQGSDLTRRSVQHGGSAIRRNLRSPRQVVAAHYGADSAMFGMDDEHTGNGRAKHNEGIFKAWRPTDWVTDLGMGKHFMLSRDGRLTVYEPGLYIIYGQIHYLDEHDENGFHLLVNGQPILQCMVYSPGTGHKSRSCFSAQITMLEAGDTLVLKDVGPARYTLFQHDKSFFGLAKLGESRPQQQQQQQQQQHTIPQPREESFRR